MKFGDLPAHLVLFYLWRAARPNEAPLQDVPRPIRCGADVKCYLDGEKGREKSFVWLDHRPMFVTVRGQTVTTKWYAHYNGKQTPKKALELLQRAVEWFTEELGSREAALQYLTETEPAQLNIDVEREYGAGRALFDAICPPPQA